MFTHHGYSTAVYILHLDFCHRCIYLDKDSLHIFLKQNHCKLCACSIFLWMIFFLGCRQNFVCEWDYKTFFICIECGISTDLMNMYVGAELSAYQIHDLRIYSLAKLFS